MTAPNHALTGALIGLTIANPWVALPLAFVSHLICDAIPHYDPPGSDMVERFRSRKFVRDFLVVGVVLCFMIVLLLAAFRPQQWLTAAVCAFLATSPDLLWIPRFLYSWRNGKDRLPTNWFLRLHGWLQWRTGPQYVWVEALWGGALTAVLATLLLA